MVYKYKKIMLCGIVLSLGMQAGREVTSHGYTYLLKDVAENCFKTRSEVRANYHELTLQSTKFPYFMYRHYEMSNLHASVDAPKVLIGRPHLIFSDNGNQVKGTLAIAAVVGGVAAGMWRYWKNKKCEEKETNPCTAS